MKTVNSFNSWLLLSALLLTALMSPAFGAGLTTVGPQHQLKLQTPASFLPGLPFLARLEVFQPDGHRAWDVWDAEATLSSPTPGVSLSTNRIHLYNGLGSILVLVTNSGDFELVATVGTQQTNKILLCKTNPTITTVSGALSGTNIWSGIIHVTGDTTNTGTLIIEPDTWVLLDGVASKTNNPNGIDLENRGKLLAQGSEEQPITFTSSTNGFNWGELRHSSGSLAMYQHAMIHKGGRTPVPSGHTGAGCLLRVTSCTNIYENCSLTDTTFGNDTMAKTMSASSSWITFTNCLLSRSLMGPETSGTGLQCLGTYFIDMIGSPIAPQKTNDNDAIYPHDAGSKPILFRDCVFARTQDDGIDTLHSVVDVENCIIRNCDNMAEDSKGISAYGGEVRLRNCLIVDNKCGVSAKDEASIKIRMDHCTVVALVEYALGAQNKTGGMWPTNIDFQVTNSIFRTLNPLTNSVFASPGYGDTNLHLFFCDLAETWDGAVNCLTSDPLLVNVAAHDYQLQPSSPCLDAGDPDSPPDPDGTRANMGYLFPFTFNDTQNPVLACPTEVVTNTLPGQCEAIVSFDVSATDNYPGVSVACVPPSGSVFPAGTNFVSCTATDAAGNTNACSFPIAVNDTEPPLLSCPDAVIIAVNDPAQCHATNVEFAINSPPDTCPGVALVCTPPFGSTFDLGTNAVTCQATDAAGNAAQCSFAVIVLDQTAPAIVCPTNVVVSIPAGQQEPVVDYPMPLASDDCSTVTVLCLPLPGSPFPVGTNTVTCLASDQSGNTNACTFTVAVNTYALPRLAIGPADAAGLQLGIQGDPGQIYLLEISPDLQSPWSTFMTLTNSSGQVQCADPSITNLTQRFYRVRLQ